VHAYDLRVYVKPSTSAYTDPSLELPTTRSSVAEPLKRAAR
jgi:hypothetical protein